MWDVWLHASRVVFQWVVLVGVVLVGLVLVGLVLALALVEPVKVVCV